MTSRQRSDIYAETLAVFDRNEYRYEPLTTPEVAEALNAERRTVYERLETLVDRGDIETKRTGSNSRVWWRRPPGSSNLDAESGDGTTDPDERGAERTEGGGPVDDAPDAGKRDWRSRAMESVIDGIAILDADGRYRHVNETHATVYGYDGPEAFRGESWRMCYQGDELARLEEEALPILREEGAWRGEATGTRADGTTFPQEVSLTVAEEGGIICVVRDITERKEREQRLRDANRFNEELVENAPFGMFRLDEELRITYENSRAEEIIGLPEGKDGSDAIGVDIRKLPPIVETGQADFFGRLQDGETIEFDFPFESIYGKSAYFTGRAVPVYRDGAFDGAILMATDISDRREKERKLERQREQLAALDELNDVVRGITEAVIEQSTREEIERVVCERLAASDSYRFAWTAAMDAGPRLSPRAEAGVDGYLDDLSVTIRSKDEADHGPIEEVIRTGEMRVTRNAGNGEGRVHADAREFDYRSSAVIPIVHQGMSYGVLGVCSGRSDAFAEGEREVVGQLGDVVGHAIAAVDRKRALMSDEVVELEIMVPRLLDVRNTPTAADGTITIDRVTPLGDDEYLMYGTATTDGACVLHALNEQRPDWTEMRTFDEADDEARFEQRLSDPPITSTVADHGGNFRAGRIENGEYSVTVEFPPGTDIRRVIDRIRETYFDARITSHRQVVRENPSSRRVLADFAEALTGRQRTALEAGYFGGFFEWPRHRNGEEVADSLDIGASTFHQHVRKAERKLLDIVFDEL